MKSLVEYINESMTLTRIDRDTLTEILGFVTGQEGEDSDIKQYEEFISKLSDDEKKSLESLFDLCHDNVTYPKLTKKLLDKKEIALLSKLSEYCFDNNICDISDIIEKIN